MKKPNLEYFLLAILRASTFMCFAGWTWTHLYWEGPYTSLLWHEGTFELAESWGVSWEEYVGTGANDGIVQKWIGRIGWLYLLCTILTLTVRKNSRFQKAALLGGSLLLVVLSYAKYVGAQQQLPMFIEHGGQILTPVILVLALSYGPRHRATVITAIVAFIMTFAGHGSFAIGLWPTPANFYGMTRVVLGVEYETANLILRIAGVLDFVVCVAIFVPYIKQAAAIYSAAWGFLTAIARPVAGMSTSLLYFGADQFLHEAVLRGPHFLIPTYLFCLWTFGSSSDPESPSEESVAAE
ncbi:MAG: hypothetical protein AAF483_20135 [Planctomycetota bacterium]